jgi:hypothetical protein
MDTDTTPQAAPPIGTRVWLHLEAEYGHVVSAPVETPWCPLIRVQLEHGPLIYVAPWHVQPTARPRLRLAAVDGVAV